MEQQNQQPQKLKLTEEHKINPPENQRISEKLDYQHDPTVENYTRRSSYDKTSHS